MIGAGTLDRRVTLLRRVEVGRDGLNAPVIEWLPIATVWAEKIHRAEDERFAAEQRYAVRTVSFRIRWRADLTEADKLVCERLEYDIKGIRELGRREGLEISAEAQP